MDFLGWMGETKSMSRRIDRGKDTMEALLKVDPNVKAIVSSGYSTDPVMANFSKYKFKGVLEKPFTFNEVKLMLSKWL